MHVPFVRLVDTLVLENLVTLITLNIVLTMLHLHVCQESALRVRLATDLTNFCLGAPLLFGLFVMANHVAVQCRLSVEHVGANLTGEPFLLMDSLVVSDCTLGGEVFLTKATFKTLAQVHVLYVVIQMSVIKEFLITQVALLSNMLMIL